MSKRILAQNSKLNELTHHEIHELSAEAQDNELFPVVSALAKPAASFWHTATITKVIPGRESIGAVKSED